MIFGQISDIEVLWRTIYKRMLVTAIVVSIGFIVCHFVL